MLQEASPFYPEPTPQEEIKAQRVNAAASVSFECDKADGTKLSTLYQKGSAKIRFPKSYDDFNEAVLINTAGGLTGGDEFDWKISLNERAKVVVSTQACEKAYRASSGVARVQTKIEVADKAELHWLPQETILYEHSALSRRFDVSLTGDARFLAVEAVMLGRQAMGETIQSCYFQDRWRIRCDGKLIFADDIRLDGDIPLVEQQTALMADNKAVASLLYVGPEDDELLNRHLIDIRAAVSGSLCAFSAFNNKITGRFLAPDTYSLRRDLVAVLKLLRGRELPKVWRL